MTRIVFVTTGSFSGINSSVLNRLVQEFPDVDVESLDVPRWIRSQRLLLAANLFAVLAERGPRVFLDRQRLWGAFFRTAFMSRVIRRRMSRRRGSDGLLFTLQTQSLFDASVPGVPHFVYTDHTELVNQRYLDHGPRYGGSDRWVMRERQIYDNARLVFTMSSHVSASLVEQYGLPPERVVCVGAGSNVIEQDPGSHGPDPVSRTILFVGRDWNRKGGPDLVAAFSRVREAAPNASLEIVGCSPNLSQPGVNVLGELPPDEVRRRYTQAAVFCMPTLVEPFGIVFVEALAHGLPVIATDVGALPDIVQDGKSGYLHQPHDVEGLARSLCILLEDPERRRRMGATGRAFVKSRYTWTRAVGQIAQEIRACL